VREIASVSRTVKRLEREEKLAVRGHHLFRDLRNEEKFRKKGNYIY